MSGNYPFPTADTGWVITKGVYRLQNNGFPVAELQFRRFRREATFTIADRQFHISNEGLWKPRRIIRDHNKQTVAVCTGTFWGAEETMAFTGGSTYKASFRNAPLWRWIVFRGETKILSYGLEFHKLVRQPALKVYETNIPVVEFWLLIFLGFFRTYSMLKEEDAAALIAVSAASSSD